MEYLHTFTFLIKHISGQANKVVSVLSRRNLVVQEGKVQVLGFEFINELYGQDFDFQDAFEAYKSPVQYDRGRWA